MSNMNPQSENKDQLTHLVEEKPGRPVAITVICILGFIGAGLAVIGLLATMSFFMAFGIGYFIFLIASVALGLLSLIWMWQMKKKGAYLYAANFVLGQIMTVVFVGTWTMSAGFFIALAVTAIALYYSKDMQ